MPDLSQVQGTRCVCGHTVYHHSDTACGGKDYSYTTSEMEPCKCTMFDPVAELFAPWDQTGEGDGGQAVDPTSS